jgi:hypothetical protein
MMILLTLSIRNTFQSFSQQLTFKLILNGFVILKYLRKWLTDCARCSVAVVLSQQNMGHIYLK